MKFFGLVFIFCFHLGLSYANAQEAMYEPLLGTWKYKSPKGKDKLAYTFSADKKFKRITDHKGIEINAEGDFQIEKKGEMDRLKLSAITSGIKVRTITTYYLFKFVGSDTIKFQTVNDKQENWRPETKRNTMIFVKEKEKPKSN